MMLLKLAAIPRAVMTAIKRGDCFQSPPYMLPILDHLDGETGSPARAGIDRCIGMTSVRV